MINHPKSIAGRGGELATPKGANYGEIWMASPLEVDVFTPEELEAPRDDDFLVYIKSVDFSDPVHPNGKFDGIACMDPEWVDTLTHKQLIAYVKAATEAETKYLTSPSETCVDGQPALADGEALGGA